MKFALSDDAVISIQSYSAGSFKIAGRHYDGSQVVSHDKEPRHWPVETVIKLQSEDLQVLLEEDTDTIIIGTGDRLIFPEQQILAAFYEARIGVEIMDTPAACRTFNILAGEGRNVTAALIAI